MARRDITTNCGESASFRAAISERTMIDDKTPCFNLGNVVITSNARGRLTEQDILTALQRHHSGDWGNVCPTDRQENELSLSEGFRLLSTYQSSGGETFWVITESDRSVTTILMPEDY